jgi:hypothetical protein
MTDKKFRFKQFIEVSLGDLKEGEALFYSYSPSCVGRGQGDGRHKISLSVIT